MAIELLVFMSWDVYIDVYSQDIYVRKMLEGYVNKHIAPCM